MNRSLTLVHHLLPPSWPTAHSPTCDRTKTSLRPVSPLAQSIVSEVYGYLTWQPELAVGRVWISPFLPAIPYLTAPTRLSQISITPISLFIGPALLLDPLSIRTLPLQSIPTDDSPRHRKALQAPSTPPAPACWRLLRIEPTNASRSDATNRQPHRSRPPSFHRSASLLNS